MTLTVRDVAELLKLTPRMVQRYCADGRLPAQRVADAARGMLLWRISPAAIATFERSKPGRPPKPK